MSDFIVAIPLIFLYEISVNLSKIVYKRKLKKQKKWEEELANKDAMAND